MRTTLKTSALVALLLSILGCSSQSDVENLTTPESAKQENAQTIVSKPEASDLTVELGSKLEQINQYFAGSVTEPMVVVDCTLSGGTKTQCYRFTVRPEADHAIGPWCPENISDDEKAGGIWPNDGQIQQVDGSFVENLASFYNDDKWLMYDPSTGKINVTDIEECAAVPQVDPRWTNFCMHCDTQYMDGIPDITYTIPVTPVVTESKQRINRRLPMGVAFNGVKFDAPAPLEMILASYTIAPFDDCGGHVNTQAGYHYHEHNGCSKEISQDNHEAIIGFALDGHTMHSESQSADLDECNGHSTDNQGYHYHINNSGSNKFLGCYSAEHGCASEKIEDCDASKISARGGRPPRPPRDDDGLKRN